MRIFRRRRNDGFVTKFVLCAYDEQQKNKHTHVHLHGDKLPLYFGTYWQTFRQYYIQSVPITLW